jgi:hypothetical protein
MSQPVPTEDSSAGSIGTAMAFIAEFSQNVAIFSEAFAILQSMMLANGPYGKAGLYDETTGQIMPGPLPSEEYLETQRILEIKQIAHEEAVKGVSHVQGDVLRLNNEIANVRKSVEPLSGLAAVVQELLSKMPYYGTADSPSITRRMKDYTVE